MTRLTSVMLGALLALAVPVAAQLRDELRHSGTIVDVGPDGRTIVMEEMLAWQGPDDPGIVLRPITVTEDTSIRVVERIESWGEARTSRPGWTSEAIRARDLRKGDFATVTVRSHDGARAVALEVVRGPRAPPR